MTYSRSHDWKGRRRNSRAPYPTADPLSNLLERAQPLARAAGVDLEVAVAPATVAMLVDVRQIKRVLDNLVRNALQHTPPAARSRCGPRLTARGARGDNDGR